MKKISKFIILTLIIITAIKCASVKPPTGGNKDIISPTLIEEKTVPLNKSTNYKSPIISLEFDEYINLENIRQELIITPHTDVSYTTKIRKNTFTLTFDSLLETNTTYTLNFGNSIVDITEKNIAKDVKIVFSTGNELDSLYIKGNVKDLMTDKNIINSYVLLYKENDTLALKSKPFYFTKSDSSGNYKLENLKKGNYQMYVLNESDNNFNYSEREEKIGFLKENIIVDSNNEDINFLIQSYDNKELKYEKNNSIKQYVEIKFNKTVLDYTLKFKAGWENKIYSNIQENKIRLYHIDQSETDSIEVNLVAEDSLGNKIKKDIKIKFEKTKKPEKGPFKYSITPSPKYGVLSNKEFDANLKFTKPVKELNYDSILMISGQDTTVAQKVLMKLENKYNNLIINNLKTDSVVKIIFKKGAIISVENDTLNPINLGYAIKKRENFGSIEGKIYTKHKKFTIQLLDSKYHLEQEIHNIKNFKFEYVIPGKKLLRVLIDENGNEMWDKGSFLEKTQAEKVFLHNKLINVKANWEIRNEELKID